jgi:hypothetical protein
MAELGLQNVSNGGAQKPKPVSKFAAFKKEQDKINDACNEIGKGTREIQNLIERFSKATKSSEEEEISAELDKIVQRVQSIAVKTKSLIKRLNEENKDTTKFGHNEKVMREQGIKASAEKFIKRVKEYQAAQQLFNARMKETMTRRVRIIAPEKSESEIKDIIDEGKSSEIFRQVILEGKGQLASTYRDVMDTHKVSIDRPMRSPSSSWSLSVEPFCALHLMTSLTSLRRSFWDPGEANGYLQNFSLMPARSTDLLFALPCLPRRPRTNNFPFPFHEYTRTWSN